MVPSGWGYYYLVHGQPYINHGTGIGFFPPVPSKLTKTNVSEKKQSQNSPILSHMQGRTMLSSEWKIFSKYVT